MKIYVAGPYSGKSRAEIELNVRNAIDAGLKIWKKGHFPYIPHLTHWSDLRAREIGQDMNWTDYVKWHGIWVDQCDALFLLGESKGALLEYKQAKRTNKKIFHSLDEIPTVDRAPTWGDTAIQE